MTRRAALAAAFPRDPVQLHAGDPLPQHVMRASDYYEVDPDGGVYTLTRAFDSRADTLEGEALRALLERELRLLICRIYEGDEENRACLMVREGRLREWGEKDMGLKGLPDFAPDVSYFY